MTRKLKGAGLGFRREMLEDLRSNNLDAIDFFEIAPENWLHSGGRYSAMLKEFTEQKPFACHGLSLSIGSTEDLDEQLLSDTKKLMREHDISLYTEHLSWCSDDGHLYDLLPIPCTEEAVMWVANRIKRAQDILEQRIGIENASYYFSPPGAEMKEEEFIHAVVKESGCMLHLDVNNIYVNSQNFGFDPVTYMKKLPLDEVCYLHVAGHYVEEDGIIVDTHGASVIDPVWKLLDYTYSQLPFSAPEIPTCLERDFNFPAISSLIEEVERVRSIQSEHGLSTTEKLA